jgi:hypothetical protein
MRKAIIVLGAVAALGGTAAGTAVAASASPAGQCKISSAQTYCHSVQP